MQKAGWPTSRGGEEEGATHHGSPPAAPPRSSPQTTAGPWHEEAGGSASPLIDRQHATFDMLQPERLQTKRIYPYY